MKFNVKRLKSTHFLNRVSIYSSPRRLTVTSNQT